MRKIILAICAVVVLAVSSMPIYAENSASSKHYLELGLSTEIFPMVSDWVQVSDPMTGLSVMVMQYAEQEGYYSRRYGTPVLNASYYYQVLPWLQVGAEAGAGMYNVTNLFTDNTTSNKIVSYRNASIYLTAGVRFNFYQTDFVQLYSGLSLGAILNVESYKAAPGMIGFTPSYSGAGFTFHATALGVRFGRQVYGFAELGCGYKGALSLGIGTRL